MDLLLIELVLWVGLLFLFWALKDGLGRVESDLKSAGLINAQLQASESFKRSRFVCPEELAEPIGTYKDEPIYQYAYIKGYRYRFDHVSPNEDPGPLREEERCLQPGLVYVRCDERREPAG